MRERTFDVGFFLDSITYRLPAGGDQVIFRISGELMKRGYTVCFLFSPDGFRKYLTERGDKKLAIQSNDFLYKIIMGEFYKFLPEKLTDIAIKLQRKILRGKYDFSIIDHIPTIVVVNGNKRNLYVKNIIATYFRTAFIVDRLKIKCNRKLYLIQNREDDPSLSGKIAPYATEAYNLNLQKIVINRGLYKRFEKDNPEMIRIGIDMDRWRSKNTRKENVILFPLRREKYKGADIIIEALDKIRNELKGFKLIGFGNLSKENVPDWIEFHRDIPDEDLRELYGKSRIFVLPSRAEGFGLTNLEAMANECAVISTKFFGYDTYLVDRENSLLVETEDTQGMSEAVLSLIKDPELMERISKNGLNTALEYSQENMVNDFERIIKTQKP